MSLQIIILNELGVAVWAMERLKTAVRTNVCLQVLNLSVVPFAMFAHKNLVAP